MSTELIVFLLIFAGTSLVVLLGWALIAWMAERWSEHIQQRLAAADAEVNAVIDDRLSVSWANRFDRWFERMVFRADLEINASAALAVIFLSGIFLAVVVFVWRYETEAWLAVPAFCLGAAVPLIFFLWRQQAWRRILQHQLPDAFFLLARSIRAGRSVDQAFRLLGEHSTPPLAREFARMHRQLELGLSLSQVLGSAADRLGLVDFNVFASVLGLHRTTGGNLPALLDRLASSTRDHNQFEGQYRAATVLGRYSAAFILLMVGIILIHLFFFQRNWAARFFTVAYGTCKITDNTFVSLRGEGVPEAVLSKLKPLQDKEFTTTDQLARALGNTLTRDEQQRWQQQVLNRAQQPTYDFTGPIMFAAAIVLEVLGGLLLYALTRYEY